MWELEGKEFNALGEMKEIDYALVRVQLEAAEEAEARSDRQFNVLILTAIENWKFLNYKVK